MSSKTIYTCDRCGKEKQNDPQFLRRLSVERPDAWQLSEPKGFIDVPVAVQWCQECYFALGLIKPWRGHPEIPNNPPSPTMEELLREMLRDIVREKLLPHLERLGVRVEDVEGGWVHIDSKPVSAGGNRFFKP